MPVSSMPMRAGDKLDGGGWEQLLGLAGQMYQLWEREGGYFLLFRHVVIGLTVKSVQLHAQVVKAPEINIPDFHRQCARFKK